MKKTTILMFLAFAAMQMMAQPKDMERKRETMKAMKVGYITQELNLTSAEAEKFWPVYNELDTKIETLRKSNKDLMRTVTRDDVKIEDVPDAELQNMMLKTFETEEGIIKAKKEYHEKFIKVLGVQKTAKLYKAEMDFHRDMVRKSKGGGEKGKQTSPTYPAPPPAPKQ